MPQLVAEGVHRYTPVVKKPFFSGYHNLTGWRDDGDHRQEEWVIQ
jgi:hypothetical protein